MSMNQSHSLRERLLIEYYLALAWLPRGFVSGKTYSSGSGISKKRNKDNLDLTRSTWGLVDNFMAPHAMNLCHNLAHIDRFL